MNAFFFNYILTVGIVGSIFNYTNGEEKESTEYTKKYNAAIAEVSTYPTLTGAYRFGTGFFIEHNGTKYMVTAAHVCSTESVLYTSFGIHQVLIVAPERDTCILSTWQGVATLKLGQDASTADLITAIGFPKGLGWDFREGYAHQMETAFFNIEKNRYDPIPKQCHVRGISSTCVLGVTTLSVEMLVRHGNSGGPVMDKDDAVVGILIGTTGKGFGSVVPVSDLKEVLKRVK